MRLLASSNDNTGPLNADKDSKIEDAPSHNVLSGRYRTGSREGPGSGGLQVLWGNQEASTAA